MAQEHFECRPRGHVVPLESFCCFFIPVVSGVYNKPLRTKCFYRFCVRNQDARDWGGPWVCQRRKKLPGQFTPRVNS